MCVQEWRRSQTKQAVMWMEEQERLRRHAEYLPDVATEVKEIICLHNPISICIAECSQHLFGALLYFVDMLGVCCVHQASPYSKPYIVVCPHPGELG